MCFILYRETWQFMAVYVMAVYVINSNAFFVLYRETACFQDFESDIRLKNITIEFLQDLVCNPTLLPAENKAASQLLRLLTKEEQNTNKVDIPTLLTPTAVTHIYNLIITNSC